jgi:hypothetical protein
MCLYECVFGGSKLWLKMNNDDVVYTKCAEFAELSVLLLLLCRCLSLGPGPEPRTLNPEP